MKYFFVLLMLIARTVSKIDGNNAHKYKLNFKTFTFDTDKKVQPTSITMYTAGNQEISMALDTAFGSLILPSTTKNSVKKNDLINYNGTITSDPSQVILNLEKISDESSIKIKGYNVDISKIQNWAYSNTGILGLAPSSPYWRYIPSTYANPDGNDFVTVSLDITNKGGKDSFDIGERDFSNSGLYVGGPKPSEDVAWYDSKRVTDTLKKDINELEAFVFTSVDVQLSKEEDKEDYQKQSVCLLSDTNFFIAVKLEEFKTLGAKILKQLCGVEASYDEQTQKWDKSCEKSDSDYKLKNVNMMSFRFYSSETSKDALFQMPVKPNYFLNIPDSGEIQLGISILDDNMIKKCGNNNVDAAFGRQFLLAGKFYTELKDEEKPIYRYGISSKIVVYSKWLMYTFVGLTILITIFIVILCLNSRKRSIDYDDANQDEEEFSKN